MNPRRESGRSHSRKSHFPKTGTFADQTTGQVSPSADGFQSPQVTGSYYDSLGRVIRTVLPDGTGVTNEFYPAGLTGRNYGSRTYPAGYGYEYAGRMKTMTNWSGFGGAGDDVELRRVSRLADKQSLCGWQGAKLCLHSGGKVAVACVGAWNEHDLRLRAGGRFDWCQLLGRDAGDDLQL